MTTDAVGGVWTYALELAASLASAGLSVTLAVLGPPATVEQAAAARRVRGLDLIDTGLELDWRAPDRGSIETAGRRLAALAGEIGADLVHLNGPALAAGGGFHAPVLGVCHSCLASWWAAVKTGPMPAEFVWRTEALRRGLAACDGLVAPSRAFAEAATRAPGGSPPRVVHNGRSPIAEPRGEPRESAVLGAGRLWDEGKNAAVLDAAAALCGAPVRLAGPVQGPDGQRVAFAHAEALGSLAPSALGERMARTAIFASAALYEPFGLAALEAAGAGCALVLSDIPTHRELWEGAALFAGPTDPAAFAAAIDGLLADGRQRRDWAARARRRASRYSVEAMTSGVLAAYRAIAPDLPLAAPEALAPPAEAAA